MGRLIIALALGCAGFLTAAAQYDINYDIKTTEQVGLNAAAQEGVEILHNIQVDSIRKKQERLAELTVSYSGLKELYMATLQNVRGFNTESGIYKSIVSTSLSIMTHAAQATSLISGANITEKAVAIYNVSDLVVQAAHLGNLFFDIVNNAEVSNPLKGKMEGAAETKKDRLNLLNRYERLEMALRIATDLQGIDRKLIMVKYYLRHASLSDLLFRFDRETWIAYYAANFYTNHLIEQWRHFVK